VRLYQALETAGQQVKLDIYEGMWHVFQVDLVPESEVAIKKSAGFIHQHLGLVK
jgi:acetyl esterase/lipase